MLHQYAPATLHHHQLLHHGAGALLPHLVYHYCTFAYAVLKAPSLHLLDWSVGGAGMVIQPTIGGTIVQYYSTIVQYYSTIVLYYSTIVLYYSTPYSGLDHHPCTSYTPV